MKKFSIIGAIFFAIAVGIGYFANFEGDMYVQIGLSAFGLAFIILGSYKKAKADGKFGWQFVVSVIGAVIGGVLCAIGGASDTIFATIAGAVVALLAVIFGLANIKKKSEKAKK